MTEIFGDAIELSRDGPIATVTLNRGDGRNALSLKTMQALIDVAAALRGDTTVNVVILSGATYKGIHYMESVEFCGLACHSVMEPEHTAHALGPHSRVSCAGCHIGPGADWGVVTGFWAAAALLAGVLWRTGLLG